VILVDSSVWVDYFNGQDTPQTNLLDSLLGNEPLAILFRPGLPALCRAVGPARGKPEPIAPLVARNRSESFDNAST